MNRPFLMSIDEFKESKYFQYYLLLLRGLRYDEAIGYISGLYQADIIGTKAMYILTHYTTYKKYRSLYINIVDYHNYGVAH